MSNTSIRLCIGILGPHLMALLVGSSRTSMRESLNEESGSLEAGILLNFLQLSDYSHNLMSLLKLLPPCLFHHDKFYLLKF